MRVPRCGRVGMRSGSVNETDSAGMAVDSACNASPTCRIAARCRQRRGLGRRESEARQLEQQVPRTAPRLAYLPASCWRPARPPCRPRAPRHAPTLPSRPPSTLKTHRIPQRCRPQATAPPLRPRRALPPRLRAHKLLLQRSAGRRLITGAGGPDVPWAYAERAKPLPLLAPSFGLECVSRAVL